MADYSNLSDEDLMKLYNQDYSNMSDEGLRDVYAQSNQTDIEQQQPLKASVRKIDLRPSRLVKAVPKAIAAATVGRKKNLKFKDAYNKADEIYNKLEQEHPFLVGGVPKAVDFLAAMALPMTKVKAIGGLGNTMLSGLYQGGLIGGLDSLANRGDLSGLGLGAGTGLTVGTALGSIPYISKLAQPVGRATKWVTSKVTGLNPKTIERAVQPDSVALDLTDDTAQNLLMNTTERVRNDYADLLNKKGEKVQEALGNLKEDFSYPVNVLKNDIDRIYDNYSLSGNQDLNVARNEAGKVYNSINELLEGSQGAKNEAFNNVINNAKQGKHNLPDVTTGRYKNSYYKKNWATENNAIEEAARRYDSEILGEIKNNPEILNNPKEIERLERKIANFSAPKDYLEELYTNFYNTIGEASESLAKRERITPKELYDINRNISAKTQWDNPNAKIQNDVLEQIYGKYSERLGDISKDLKSANAEYAKLKDFQKNEGIRRILNNQNNIDTASSALKNYNSTITKGNTGRNVQDLEKILVDNGYSPFLNDIQDVNAAQDLLKSMETGFNFLGVNNLLKGAARGGLRAQRYLNANPLPSLLEPQRLQIPVIYGLNRLIQE